MISCETTLDRSHRSINNKLALFVRLVLLLATHVIVAKMRFAALAAIVFRLTGSRAWDADLFPAAYQAVFTDSENTINQPIQTGLENIQNGKVTQNVYIK